MPIATICKSCNTISLSVVDRCKFCASQRVKTTFIDGSVMKNGPNGRLIYNVTNNKARSQAQKA